MEKIQMTEEQARELFSVIGLVETIDMAIDESKKHGYIRKSAVEEAEEMYNEYQNNTSDKSEREDRRLLFNLKEKQHEAIQHLKNKLKARSA